MENSTEIISSNPTEEGDVGFKVPNEGQIGENRQDKYAEIRTFLDLAGETSSQSLDEYIRLTQDNPQLAAQLETMMALSTQLPEYVQGGSLDKIEYFRELPEETQQYTKANLSRIFAVTLRDQLEASNRYLKGERPVVVIDSGFPQEMSKQEGPGWFISRIYRYNFCNLSADGYWGSAVLNQILAYEDTKRIWEEVDIAQSLQDDKIRQAVLKVGFKPDQAIKSQNLWDQLDIKRFIHNYREFPEVMQEGQIDESLKELYENPEFKLREFEGKTVDTQQSLRQTTKIIKDWLAFAKNQLGFNNINFTEMLDICGGEGRSGIPFTYMGVNVNAYDISPRMVHDSRQRIEEDLQSGQLLEMARTAEMPIKPREQRGRFNQVVGNFFDFDLAEYKNKFPDASAPQVATIMWHSLGFAGSPEGIQKVLENAYGILAKPGLLIVEMPNRNFGAYKAALEGFAKKHPEYPEGTMIDKPSKQTGQTSEEDGAQATPRYFPLAEELCDIAGRVGFVIDPVQKYYVEHLDKGKSRPFIEENLFAFQKL